MSKVHFGGDRVLVLSELPVRSPQQHGEERRQQVGKVSQP